MIRSALSKRDSSVLGRIVAVLHIKAGYTASGLHLNRRDTLRYKIPTKSNADKITV
jgi:hypothetical protein